MNSGVNGLAYPESSSKSSMPSTCMNRPPTDSICSAADFLTSEAYTTAPNLFAVAMAWRPATPDPIITTLDGLTVPAEVVIIGIAFGTIEAPKITDLYPARLSWLELTSMD